MDVFKSAYMSRRDTAQQEFEQLQFKEENKRASLQEVCTRTLARYDAEIDWYDRHADRRRVASGAVRIIAVVLGTLSLLFLNIRAFSTSTAPATVPTPATGFEWELTTMATAVAIVAAGVLLLDAVFQITARYARWRVAEYTIRVMRSAFEIEFFKEYGAKEDGQIDLSTFNAAKVMAIEKFKAVEEEIKAETESWQQSLDKAMTALRQKIEKDTEEAKKGAAEAVKVDKERLEKEKEEIAKREPVLLDVTIEATAGRPAPLTLVVRDKRKREIERTANAKSGQTFPFTLPPGPYTVHLLGPEDEQVSAKSKRLAPATDATLTI